MADSSIPVPAQSRGAGGPSVEIDLTRGKDREYLRRAISKGWEVKPEDLARYKQGLDEALELSRQQRDAREINACVKTMATIVGQIQADDHLEAKLEAEAEKPDSAVNVVVFNIVEAKNPRLQDNG